MMPSLTFQGRVGRHAIECEGSPLSFGKETWLHACWKTIERNEVRRSNHKEFLDREDSSKGAEADGRGISTLPFLPAVLDD